MRSKKSKDGLKKVEVQYKKIAIPRLSLNEVSLYDYASLPLMTFSLFLIPLYSERYHSLGAQMLH